MNRNTPATMRRAATKTAVGALGAGWALLLADDLTGRADLPSRLHDDIAGLLVAGTVVLAVTAAVRGKILFEAMRLGRLVEAESRQRAERRNMEEVTLGIGIRN